MTIQTAADITGDNAAHALGTTKARALFLTATGSSTARFGDANVSASRGVELPNNVMVAIYASGADLTDTIDLSAVKAYVPTGTTLTYSWGI